MVCSLRIDTKNFPRLSFEVSIADTIGRDGSTSLVIR